RACGGPATRRRRRRQRAGRAGGPAGRQTWFAVRGQWTVTRRASGGSPTGYTTRDQERPARPEAQTQKATQAAALRTTNEAAAEDTRPGRGSNSPARARP